MVVQIHLATPKKKEDKVSKKTEQMNELDRKREEIARETHSKFPYSFSEPEDWDNLLDEAKAPYYSFADQILSLVEVRADNQESPKFDYEKHLIAYQDYTFIQNEMLSPKDGYVWVKCIKKEKK